MFKQMAACACIFALVQGLAACSFNPFTTDNTLTGKPGPTLAGGAIGAGSVALLGGSKYAIGLAGLGGAALGYYVSTLNFDAGGVTQIGGQVFTLGDYVTIEIPTDQIFDENSADLLPEASPVLQSTVEVLKRYPDNNILVSGNTSGFGTRRWELSLSERRAREVAAYLWAHGINGFKGGTQFNPNEPLRTLSYVGYGNYFPIANNIKADSIRQNSRIQITSYPSRDRLKICKDQKVFANIGELNQASVNSSAPVSANGYQDKPLRSSQPVKTAEMDSNLYDMNDGMR
ncbi:MAG TPA: OmpA family protein [Gammaproteobacteria bacterium]|nr:OmpA family protein [Gammaproteobacteria bacterium]